MEAAVCAIAEGGNQWPRWQIGKGPVLARHRTSVAPSVTAMECLEEAFDWESSLETLCSELNMRPPRARRAPKALTKEWPPPCPDGTCDSRGCVCAAQPEVCISAADLHSFLVDLEPPAAPARGRARKKRLAPEPAVGPPDRVRPLDGVWPSSSAELNEFFGVDAAVRTGAVDADLDMACYERMVPPSGAWPLVAKIC